MRSELKLDPKEQAEHRMLVDLARNDLGRVAEFGSVQVSEREVVEEYSHVFHLVSEVRARVKGDRDPWEMFAALFPGGTITGAPKIRAMEVISDLEPVARGMYTGALGWLGPKEMQFNILIRSAVMRANEAVVQAGAGIVWDSDPAREWRESLRKGEAVRVALDLTPVPSPSGRGGR
jgi:para-aminobenzoate synthetase component 1